MFISKVYVCLLNVIFLINLVLGKGVSANRQESASPLRDHTSCITMRLANIEKEGDMQDQKQLVKNKVSEGMVWLDSEGLGLAQKPCRKMSK